MFHLCAPTQPYFCAAGVPRNLLVKALEQAAGRCKKVSFVDDCDDTIDVGPKPPAQLEDSDHDADPTSQHEHVDHDDIPPLQTEDTTVEPVDVPITAEPEGTHSSWSCQPSSLCLTW